MLTFDMESYNFKTVSVGKFNTERKNSPVGNNKRVIQSDTFKNHMSYLRREDNKNREFSGNRNEYSQKDVLIDKSSVFINDKDSKGRYSDFRNKDSGNRMTVTHDVNNSANNDVDELTESMTLLGLTGDAEYLKSESKFDAPIQNDVLKKKMRSKVYSEYEISSNAPKMFSTVSKSCHQKKNNIQFQTGDYDNKFVKKNYRHRRNRRSSKSPQYPARDSDDEFKTADSRTTGGIGFSSKCSATYHHHHSKKFTDGYSKQDHKIEYQSPRHCNHKKRLSTAERNVIEILNSARTFKTAEPMPINYFDGAGINCFKNVDSNLSDADDKPKNTPPPGGFVAVKPYTSADLAASQPNIIWSELWELEEEWEW